MFTTKKNTFCSSVWLLRKCDYDQKLATKGRGEILREPKPCNQNILKVFGENSYSSIAAYWLFLLQILSVTKCHHITSQQNEKNLH